MCQQAVPLHHQPQAITSQTVQMLNRPYNYETESLLDIFHHMVLAAGVELITPIVQGSRPSMDVFHCTHHGAELRFRLQDNGAVEIVRRGYDSPKLIDALEDINNEFREDFEQSLIDYLQSI